MKISLNELKKLVKIPADISDERLVELIGARLVEVENVVDWTKKYAGIYLVKILEASAIEGTHLHLCRINAGKLGEAQVVCGAPNVKAGNWAAWIAPGAIVPATIDDSEPFEIGVRTLRGFQSHGMLAAADELDLGEDHAGIIVIDPQMLGADGRPIYAGEPFGTAFGLDDLILEIENKSLTHRPDTFGLIGFAREVAGILGVKFKEPDFLKTLISSANSTASKNSADFKRKTEQKPEQNSKNFPRVPLKITIADLGLCPRYAGAVLGLTDAPHTEFFTLDDVFLLKSGMRPISPIVDLTNIIMLQTGQPLHAFDFDKLCAVSRAAKTHAPDFSPENQTKTRTDLPEPEPTETGKDNEGAPDDPPEILVRAARTGETLKLFNGRTIELEPFDIVITASDTPVALAGAMGGDATKIDASTRRVLLEAATFSLYNLRKTQMHHGIFSEAITRFTKGQPAELCLAVAKLTVERLAAKAPFSQIAPAGNNAARTAKNSQAAPAAPNANATFFDCYPDPQKIEPITISAADINALLGAHYTPETIKTTLENVGFKVKTANNKTAGDSSADKTNGSVGSKIGPCFEITPPPWRTDIHIREDIIEEIGRLNGFDLIPQDFPTRPCVGVSLPPLLNLKNRLREILALRLDAHELLTYSFVSERLQTLAGENPADSYQIVNSLSPELQCFRQSLVPSLLEKIRPNLKAGYSDFALFEFNQVTRKSFGLSPENVPLLAERLGLAMIGDYYGAKARLAATLKELGVDWRPEKIAAELTGPAEKSPFIAENAGDIPAYFEPSHSAKVTTADENCLGWLGEIRGSVLKSLKITAPVAGFELDLNHLLAAEPETRRKIFNLSKFPATERDLTLKTLESLEFARVERALKTALSETGLNYTLTPVSLYRASGAETKNLTFHLKLAAPDRTLNAAEISAIMEEINDKLRAGLGVEPV